jgi:hypothetical protein
MMNGPPTPLAHTTSIHHYDVPLSQVIQSQDFLYCRHPHKEDHSRRSLSYSNTLLRKWGTSRNQQHIIKGHHFKLLPFGGDPTYFIFTALPQSDIIQKLKKRTDQIHLPIMHWFGKRYIPLKISIKELHIIRHPRVFTTRNTKQVWKSFLQELVRTPQIMRKLDLGPISHPVSNKKKKLPTPSLYIPPSHSEGTHYLFGTPISPYAIIFSFHH